MGYDSEHAGVIVLDVETCPSPNVAELLDTPRPPANYKDPAKIAAYQAEKTAERIANAGLEADLCEIVAIGWCIPGNIVEARTRLDHSEEDMIKLLWTAIGDRRIVGFNCLNFDLPVLIRRSQLLGIRPQAISLDRYRTPHIDLLEKLTFQGRLTMRSLSFYCRRFGLANGDYPVKGSDVAQLVADGNWPAIAAHVRADVEKTAALAQKLGYL